MQTRASIVERLAERYYSRVLGFARQLTDENTAEDVTQDVFTRLLGLEDLEHRTISVSYLLKAAHNLVKGMHRTKLRRERHLNLFARAESSRRTSIAESREPAGEGAANLRFDRLPTNQLEAVRLTVARDLSLQQASAAMGVRVTTLTNWKYRGLRALGDDTAA